MIHITLKDGAVKEFEKGTSALEIAKSLSEGLARAALAVDIDGDVKDIRTPVNSDCNLNFLTFDDEGGKKTYWHTTSHILAQAVKRLYPNTKLAIGPSIDSGFYYDFDTDIAFTPEIMAKIEAEMKKIIKENLPIERFELPRDEAVKFMKEKNEPYKVQLIEELPEGEVISFYKQGEYTDLCAGPHLLSTGKIKAYKLTQCTGAYWKGDAKNKMLQRIYGTAFTKAVDLEEHLARIEEAKKRDHNKLGRELELFTTVDYIGQGLPILMPKGAKVVQLLQRFVEDEEERRGYQLTKTPFLAKSDFYKISGHWDHYREGMFVLGNEETDKEVFALRPMTCPFQFQVYLAAMRSYRDLPMRLNETSTLFRNESSGEMHGLIRVRQFTISEGHLACRPDQLEEEFKGCVDLALFMLKTLGLDSDVSYRFSKWDENNKEKYIGSPEEWESVQDTMRGILNHLGIKYTEASGEAAFYGPKLDIQIKNVYGKEDTLITVQIDFQLAKRFEMVYIDEDGKKKYPYVIHRTSIGCYERTLALLIEKYAGAFPTWLAPIQVKVLPISEKMIDYAKSVSDKLKSLGIRTELDDRSEKIGYKIRSAQLEKVPYMLVVGEKEAQEGLVAVRNRKSGDLGTMTLDEFTAKIKQEIDSKDIG
ncbi:MAG: threonine--tRNA ligase [Bacillota bacterium]|nr:threonine--tRNA ligase [Bacillota bacterium]